MEEYLVFKMTDFIDELSKDGIAVKALKAREIITALYLYLRRLGFSHEEMLSYVGSLENQTPES